MIGSLLVRGMLAGVLAGILGFAFAHTFAEPSIDSAIAFEEYVEYEVHHEAPEVELVSRSLQSTAGLVTGTLLYGVSMGGIFALAFTAAYGRVGGLSARGTAALVGLLSLVAVYLAPFLKYPANPPSIGNEETIQFRTAIYLVLLLASVVAMVFAVILQRRLVTRFGGWNATLVAVAAYVVAMAVCYLVFPGINEVPQTAVPTVIDAVTDADVTFPPTVLWNFRIASIGLQAVMWTTISLVFGVLAERLVETSARAAPASRGVRFGRYA
jgi:pimeloyl-ACP methyl ester carboxylesterase